ncbi:putative peptidoglycan glycosyltransferase FtsW [Saliniramus sp.]|uniref:FtsW/RodA/SpoVE family cell cycle protein n=1 Tax=Saliniramus sp. TaxID=2986772 RepID=UPI002BDE361D|nr:putative peptidoglycan glycosyltransferase FtsW [Saliniramus sp.]HMB12151.1 putative peptidoglycan glycosyltransferase FtsW [Saliniramus sp.]
MVSRAQRSLVGDWWWTIDRSLLAALIGLMVIGLVMLMGGGPPVASRIGLSTFHFVERQALFLLPALMVLVTISFLDARLIRRLALATYVIGMMLVLAAIQYGPEIKGAHRWISLMGLSIQPSEFVKPAFVILTAWAFSETARRPDLPAVWIAFALLPLTITPLILQPDFGQTMLITAIWAGMFFIAGLHWFWVMGLGGVGVLGIISAYNLLPHVRERITRFLDSESGDTFQVDMALESFARGGWLGRGPGEGTVKRVLPDAHTDFIFAVTAEEFGIAICLVIVMIYAFIVLRGLLLAGRNEDSFSRLAVSGLLLLFGLQASINMLVNVNLLPAKGMTLPFISYGVSSLFSLALAAGFLIALTRKRPHSRLQPRAYVPRPAGA